MRITLNELKSIISEEAEKAKAAHIKSAIKGALAALEQEDVSTAKKFLRDALSKAGSI
jgi:hypothetical protein